MQRRGLVPLVVAVLTALVFATTLGNEFLEWDDELFVRSTSFRGFSLEHLRWMFTETLTHTYQPLVWLSLAVDDALWGREPFGYHLTNVVLHALAAAGVAACAQRLLRVAAPQLGARTAWLALAAALLWSVHPLRVESVAWVTERRDVLCGMFLALSCLTWLRYVEGREAPGAWWRSGRYWAALGLFTAAMLSKASPMGWCLVLLLLDHWPLRRRGWRALVGEKVPYAVVATVVSLLALAGQAEGEAIVSLEAIPPFGRLVVAGHAATFYVVKTLLPLRLRAHYARDEVVDGSDPLLLAAAALAVAITVAVWMRRRRQPAAFVAWGAYLFLLAPSSGLVPLGAHLVAERFSYLPSIPLVLLAVGGAGVALTRLGRPATTRAIAGAGAVAILALGASAAWLGTTWHDTETLFRRVLRFESDNWIAHWKLSDICYLDGRVDDAAEHLRQLDRARPNSGMVLSRLAWIEVRRGNMVEAVRWIELALEAEPDNPGVWTRLGVIFRKGGNDLGASDAYRHALELDPDHMAANYNYALLLRDEGDAAAAIDHLRRSLDEESSYVPARAALGELLVAEGRSADAEAEFRAGLEVTPDAAPLQLGLGRLLHADPARRAEALPLLRSAAEDGDEETAAAARAILAGE